MIERQCSKCGAQKPLGQFQVRKTKISGRCKACERDYMVAYRERNRESLLDKSRASYAADKETRNHRSRDWRERNHDAFLRAQRHWRERHSAEYQRGLSAELADCYVRQLLVGSGVENPPPDMIEAKRAHLMVRRLIKEARQ